MNNLLRLYRDSFTGLPEEAWLLSLVVLVNRSGTMILFFLTLYLTTQLDFTVQLAGQMVSFYGAGSLGGALLGGWLTDRWGPSRVQFLSLILGGFTFILLGYVEHSWALRITLFLAALLNESFRPANVTAFAEVCPPDLRARGFALNRLAINLGVAVGPAIGGYLALINYKLIFWADGLTCILAALIFWILFMKKTKAKSASSGHQISEETSPLRDGIFLFTLLLMLIMGLQFTQLFNTWPLYLRSIFALPENRIGLLLAINAVMVALIEMPLIHKLERFNHLRIIAAGTLLLFAGFAILPFGSGFTFAIFTVVIWTTGEILVFPLSGSFIANRANEANRGKFMGMYSFTFALSFVIGPTMGSAVYDSLGPNTLWFGLGITGIFSTLGFLLIDRLVAKNQKI